MNMPVSYIAHYVLSCTVSSLSIHSQEFWKPRDVLNYVILFPYLHPLSSQIKCWTVSKLNYTTYAKRLVCITKFCVDGYRKSTNQSLIYSVSVDRSVSFKHVFRMATQQTIQDRLRLYIIFINPETCSMTF